MSGEGFISELVKETAPGDISSGYVTYQHKDFKRKVFGWWRYWIVILLTVVGLVGSLAWLFMSILASVPTAPNLWATTYLAIDFTVFSAVMIGLFILSVLVFWWMLMSSTAVHTVTAVGLIREGKKSTEEVDSIKHKTWGLIAVNNRTKIKFATILQMMALIGLIIINISFLSLRLQPYGTYYTNVMFNEDGSLVQDTIYSNATDECSIFITEQCNNNATFTFDDIMAQSFVNTQHINVVLTWVLAIAYYIQFQAFVWLEMNIHANPETTDFEFSITGNDGKGHEKELRLTPDLKYTPLWLFIPQKSSKNGGTAGARKDPTLFAVVVIIAIFMTALWILTIFQELTAAGIYNGLCSWFDYYGGWWILYFGIFWGLIVAMGCTLLALMMKDVVYKDTTVMQSYKMINSLVMLCILGVVGIVIGAIWISAHGSIYFYSSLSITCRIHPFFRTYNANKVWEFATFFLALYVLAEFFFYHRASIGKIRLLAPSVKKKSH